MADFCGGAGEGNRTLVVSLEGLGLSRFSADYPSFPISKTTEKARFCVTASRLLPQVYRTNKKAPLLAESNEAAQRQWRTL